MVEKFVKRQDMQGWDNWTEGSRECYPDGKMTQFHVALLIEPSFRSYWIYCIGGMLVGSPIASKDLDYNPFNPTEYFDWILPEWQT